MAQVTKTLALTAPIKAHGKDVAELVFNPPNGKVIRQAGYPFRMTVGSDGESVQIIDAGPVSGYISRLAAIPTSAVDDLSAPDWQAAMGIVLGFFGGAPDPATTTPTPSDSMTATEAAAG